MGVCIERNARRWFIRIALACLGTPYRWGGDDPSGFDCSGLVVECLKSVGLLSENADYTAQGLLELFGNGIISQPRPAALLFYRNDRGRAVHVTICLDKYFQIGAEGGGRTTKETCDAWEHNAFVKIRPLNYDARPRIICDPFRGNFGGIKNEPLNVG